MTIQECLVKVDKLKKNSYSAAEKIGWLNELDGQIKEEVIDSHEGACSCTFSGYTEDDDQAELIAPAPYDVIYVRWLESMIDYYNNDISMYNNSQDMFLAAYQRFKDWYFANHKPIAPTIRYF